MRLSSRIYNEINCLSSCQTQSNCCPSLGELVRSVLLYWIWTVNVNIACGLSCFFKWALDDFNGISHTWQKVPINFKIITRAIMINKTNCKWGLFTGFWNIWKYYPVWIQFFFVFWCSHIAQPVSNNILTVTFVTTHIRSRTGITHNWAPTIAKPDNIIPTICSTHNVLSLISWTSKLLRSPILDISRLQLAKWKFEISPSLHRIIRKTNGPITIQFTSLWRRYECLYPYGQQQHGCKQSLH